MPVLLSAYMVCGATCEYRRLVLVYMSYTPRDSASSSSKPVHTWDARMHGVRNVHCEAHLTRRISYRDEAAHASGFREAQPLERQLGAGAEVETNSLRTC